MMLQWKRLPTACNLIGYVEFTWHLTMKLFSTKIPERATLQKSMTSEGNIMHGFTLGNIEILGKLSQWMNAILKQSSE